MIVRNGNRTIVDSSGIANEVVDILNPSTDIANTFQSGQAVFINASGSWMLAQNNNGSTLGTHLILEASPTSFKIAKPGDRISGFTGLTPGDPMHTSVATAGGLEQTVGGTTKPVGAFAANVLAYAESATTILVTQATAFS